MSDSLFSAKEEDPALLREVYFTAWQKALKGEVLSPLEAIISKIIQRHPEYHSLFNHATSFADVQLEKFALDHNPFFHLELHVTLAEQVSINRPLGIRPLYLQLLKKYDDQDKVEHSMMECLAKILLLSFQRNESADEEKYLAMIRNII